MGVGEVQSYCRVFVNERCAWLQFGVYLLVVFPYLGGERAARENVESCF